MEILIVGKSGSGKSVLGDLIRNAIFRADSSSKIITDDSDRQVKTFGKGSNTYNLHIKQLKAEEDILSLPKSELDRYDIVISIRGGEFIERYRKVYS